MESALSEKFRPSNQCRAKAALGRFTSIDYLAKSTLLFSYFLSIDLALAQVLPESKQDKKIESSEQKTPQRFGNRQRTRVVRDQTTTIPGHEAGTGAAVFLGITGGPIGIRNKQSDFESDKEGFFLAGKAIGSFYTENWVTDIGLGWFYGEASSSDPGSGEIPPPAAGIEYLPAPVRIALNAGLFEFTPKFRLSENWQLGLHTNLFFSTNSDTTFNGVFAEQDKPEKLAALVGAQLMFGIPKKEADWRAGIEYLVDVSIDQRQIQIASFTLQFGLPIVSPDVVKKERETVTEKRKIERVESKLLKKKVIVREVTKFVFEKQQILFSRNGSVLHPDSQSFLIELVEILNSNDQLWSELTIESHIGPNLTASEADLLSEARANAVRASLVSVGLDPKRVKAIGFGSRNPIRSDSTSIRDERTVFSFSDVKDLRALSAAIANIRAKFRVPETCTELEGCE